jgi:hypothetical protein
MSVPKALTLAAVVFFALSTLADAAPRARVREAPGYGNYEVQGARPTAGSYGGYSSNPNTRDLEILADKYKPGW